MFAGLVLLFALVFDGRDGTGGIGDEDICPNAGLKPVTSTRIVRNIQKATALLTRLKSSESSSTSERAGSKRAWIARRLLNQWSRWLEANRLWSQRTWESCLLCSQTTALEASWLRVIERTREARRLSSHWSGESGRLRVQERRLR